MKARCYDIYGMTVQSAVPLPAPTVVRTRKPDVVISERKPSPTPSVPAEGEILLSLSLPNGKGHALSKDEGGYVFRCYSACDFFITHDLCSVSVVRDPDCAPAMVPLFITGNVFSLLLTLRGRCVLHASAVDVGGEAVAFLGGSGMGKSTLAAIFAAEGFRPLTDDVLRVEPNGDGSFCALRGPTEIRLRPSASALTEGFPSTRVGETADGRLVLRFAKGTKRKLPLRALVVRRVPSDSPATNVRRYEPREAFVRLVENQRVVSWTAGTFVKRQFRWLAQLVEAVPVFEAAMPSGPPFSQGLVDDLLQGVGLRRERAAS